MTGRLKVYDADSGLWKYVDGAGGTVKLLRYVPGTFGGLNVSVTTTTGPVHSATLAGLPPEAVAVSVEVIGHCTVISPGARFEVYDYDAGLAGPLKAQGFSGKVAGHYEAISAHYVKLGGTDQIDYKITVPVAGTYTLLLYVNGYWVEEDSQAIATAGGGTLGSGTTFPPAPVVGDIFFRTDYDQLFTWTGGAWQTTDGARFGPGGTLWQAGSAQPGASGSGEVSSVMNVTFPIAYAVAPIVMLTSMNFNWYPGMSGAAATTSGFSFAVRRVGQGSGASCLTQWLAIGQGIP